jgi:heat shock protein HslJ
MKRILGVRIDSIGFITLLSLCGLFAAAENGASSESPLAETSWHLVEFQSMSDRIGVIRPHDPSAYVMHLKSDGTVTMRLNCNYARGNWSAKPSQAPQSGHFEFSRFALTDLMCAPPSMDQSIGSQAEYIRSYVLENDKLYLSLMADGGIYVWQQQRLETAADVAFRAPDKGGPRNWIVADISKTLNLRERPSTDARVLTGFPRITVLDNLGCEFSEARNWCYVQRFGGGPVGYVAAEYLRPAESPDGQVMTGPDYSALLAGHEIFDATGTIPCAQYGDQPMRACEFGVARSGGGYATVVINLQDAIRRAIYFRMGLPISADTSEADGHQEFSATQENDLHCIRVGDERYEIPNVVIWGN